MAVVALKPRRGYSFTDHSVANPSTPHPGDRLDGEVDRINRAIGEIIDWVSVSLHADGSLRATPAKPSLSAASAPVGVPGSRPPRQGEASPAPVGVLGGNETHSIPGADPNALAMDWAEVSAEWAEHMPDTIPPNILAVMGVTGDHWSSRWWAHRALELVESIPGGPGGPAHVIISESPPVGASAGWLWWCTTDGQLYVFYSDLSSDQWVPATNQPAPAAIAAPAPPVPANILSPASGALLILTDTRPVYINNPGPYASLTIRLPVAVLGEMVEISFANPVAILVLQNAAAAPVAGAPTNAYGPGAAIQLRFEAPGWIYWK